jgi:hypothetical protein
MNGDKWGLAGGHLVGLYCITTVSCIFGGVFDFGLILLSLYRTEIGSLVLLDSLSSWALLERYYCVSDTGIKLCK